MTLIKILPPFAFSSRVWKVHATLQKRYTKRTPRLYLELLNWWKTKHSRSHSYSITPLDVQWWQLFCLWQERLYWSPMPSVACYNHGDFCHFAQDCPKITAPSWGTPCHHNRSHSHSHHNHSCRDRSHSFHHRHSQGNCLDRLGSHYWPEHDRWSSCHWRHACHSVFHHHNHSQYPSTDRHLRRHSCRDIPHHHRCNTSRHSSCQTNSWTTPLIVVSLAPGTPWALPIDHTQGTHWNHVHWQRHPRDPSTTRRSLFRTPRWIHPQNCMTIWIL